MSRPANVRSADGYPAPGRPITFIAGIAVALVLVWAAAACLVSLPLSLDEAVLLR